MRSTASASAVVIGLIRGMATLHHQTRFVQRDKANFKHARGKPLARRRDCPYTAANMSWGLTIREAG